MDSYVNKDSTFGRQYDEWISDAAREAVSGVKARHLTSSDPARQAARRGLLNQANGINPISGYRSSSALTMET